MNNRLIILLAVSVLIISGCKSREDVIVDISAGVFIVFLMIILLKFTSGYLSEIRWLVRIKKMLTQIFHYLIIPLYFISIAIIGTGIYFQGIHRVLIFGGLVLLIAARGMHYLIIGDKAADRRTWIEVVTLSISTFFVLLSLWAFQTKMLGQL